MNARNDKCPGNGPDDSPRKAVADNHAPVAGEHVRSTTADGAGALEVSSEVILEVPLGGTSQGVEVEAELAEGESPPLGGGVRPGEAGEAIEERAVTDVRETHEQSTIVLYSGTEYKIIKIVQRTPEGNSLK